MVVPINLITDEEQLRILKTPARRGVPHAVAAALAVDLIDTAKTHENCAGLAANQLWKKPDEAVPHVFVAMIGGEWRTYIDTTSKRSGWRMSMNEGCMSIPGYKARVVRREEITISYTDEMGAFHDRESYTGFDAVIIQHELDHMSGALI